MKQSEERLSFSLDNLRLTLSSGFEFGILPSLTLLLLLELLDLLILPLDLSLL
jgi:hypothetical protein